MQIYQNWYNISEWLVEFVSNKARVELYSLPDEIIAKFIRIADMIEAHGLEKMREPYVKHLTGKLWEMRMQGKDGIGRAIYVTASGRRVVVLHAFAKKTQKTPTAALEMAQQRLKEVI